MKKQLLSFLIVSLMLVMAVNVVSALPPTTTFGPTGPNYARCTIDHPWGDEYYDCTSQVRYDDSSYASMDPEEEVQGQWNWGLSGIPTNAVITDVKVRVLGYENNPEMRSNIQLWSAYDDESLTGYQSFPDYAWGVLTFSSTDLKNEVQARISAGQDIKLEIDFEHDPVYDPTLDNNVYIDYVSIEVTYYISDTTAPVISVDHEPQYPTCTSNIEVCATVTDQSAINFVKITCSAGSIEVSNSNVTGSAGRYCGHFSSSTMMAEDAKSLICTVIAQDVFGNQAQSGPSILAKYDCADPTAVITGSLTCDEGSQVDLSGTSSHDTVDTELAYSWSGVTSSNGASAVVDCIDDGTVSVSLTVTDNVGRTNTANADVVVSNVKPVAIISGPNSGKEGSNIILNGSETDVGTLDTHTFAWNIDDDGLYDDGAGTQVSVHCVDEELVTVSLKVTDDNNGEDTEIHTVQCQNEIPVVEAGVNQIVDEGSLVTIAPTYTDKGINDTHTVEVNWGDGWTSDLTHIYCTEGDHTVTVRVTDNDGGFGEDYLTINVKNVPPYVISTGEPYIGIVGEHIGFHAEAGDICDTVKLSWNFSPGIDASNGEIEAYWNSRFDGNVILTLDDDTDTVNVNVPVTVYDYKILLDAGWNLISIPLVPQNTAINSVFATILPDVAYEGTDVATVLQYDAVGDRWYKARPDEEHTGFDWGSISELGQIVPGYGYYIKMARDSVLYLNGEIGYAVEGEGTDPVMGIPPSVTLGMDSWNLIGVYGLDRMTARRALISLTDEERNPYYDVIYNKYASRLFNDNDLIPTEGYWLSVKKIFGDDQTIEYKANYAGSQTA